MLSMEFRFLARLYFIMTIIWVFVVWVYHASPSTQRVYDFITFFDFTYTRQSVLMSGVDLSLQKSLSFLPVLKFFRVLLYSKYFGSCPWQRNIELIKNTLMLMISLNTIFESVLLMFFYYLSRGWILTSEGAM